MDYKPVASNPLSLLHGVLISADRLLQLDQSQLPIYQQQLVALKQQLAAVAKSEEQRRLLQEEDSKLQESDRNALLAEKVTLTFQIQEQNEKIKVVVDKLRLLQLSLDNMGAPVAKPN